MTKTVVYKVGGKATTKAAYEKAQAEGRTDIERIVHVHDEEPAVADPVEVASTDMGEFPPLEMPDDPLLDPMPPAEEAPTEDDPDEAPPAEEAPAEGNRCGCLTWLLVLFSIILVCMVGYCHLNHLDDAQQIADLQAQVAALEQQLDDAPVVDGQHVCICSVCTKPEAECVCLVIRAELGKQVADLQAQVSDLEQQLDEAETATPETTVEYVQICTICGKENCTACKRKYDEALAQNAYIYKLLNSGNCTGLCPQHCVEHEAEATATPTVKPTTAPTIRPTATPTTKPTVKPTTAPTTRPTATPTTKPTTAPVCNHPETVYVEGEKVVFPTGDWEVEVFEICTTCGKEVDSFYRIGVNIDAIPSNNNSWEYDDDGEAANPV